MVAPRFIGAQLDTAPAGVGDGMRCCRPTLRVGAGRLEETTAASQRRPTRAETNTGQCRDTPVRLKLVVIAKGQTLPNRIIGRDAPVVWVSRRRSASAQQQ